MPLTRQQKKDLNITDLEAYTIALEEAINAKLEAFESRMEEKMRSLFAEFSIGQPPSPKKSQQGETSDRRYQPQEHGHIIPNPNNPRMKVDFPRWEGGPIGWISRAGRYFRFYRTADTTRVEIAAIHLEGDAIQWFNWFEHTHGARDSRSKGTTIVHSYGGDFLCKNPRRTIEPRGTKDKGRSPTSHTKAYSPLYCHLSPRTKKTNKRRAS
ncbi:hypothetical protein BHE74_00045580 [Ensete ventricosum]|nr:hypothetical protein BHE74_00045580 [Ensete ventricosum]